MRLLYNPLKYIRKAVFVFILALCSDPILALGLLIGVNVIFIVYLGWFRPKLMPYLIFDFII
jgi:hypothetical protein